MLLMKGKISDAEIVNDGILIASNDEQILFCPIIDEPSYTIRIEVKIDLTGATTIPTASLTNERGPLITISRNWYEGNTSANTDLLIGETSSDKYYMNFTVTLIGTIDRYAIELRYLILRKVKQ